MTDGRSVTESGSADLPGEIACLDQVVKRYHGANGMFAAVDDVSFVLQPRDRLAVIGESGSGKSTTARLLLGLVLPDEGTVTVLGQQWTSLRRRERARLRRRIGTVFQEPVESLDPTMNVAAIVAEPLLVHRRDLSREEMDGRVESALHRVGLPSALFLRRPTQLSGGQAQRVSIARALVNEPQLLILDEPTSALDVSVQAQILDLLEEIATSQQLTWVFITHNLHVARSVCTSVAVMRRGKLIEKGRCEAILSDPNEQYTRELVASSLLQ